jgi:hypothetical protein
MLFKPGNEIRVAMEYWSVAEVSCSGLDHATQHLVGVVDGLGRVCSPIQEFDYDKMEATTRSGKIYELHGKPSTDMDAKYVFANWCRLNQVTDVIDVTEEYWPSDDQ